MKSGLDPSSHTGKDPVTADPSGSFPAMRPFAVFVRVSLSAESGRMKRAVSADTRGFSLRAKF